MKKDSIYRRARLEAADQEPLFSSMARASEQIFCSQESLADYETGKSVPPCHVVQKMIEAYGAHDLRGQHIRECCPLISDYGQAAPSKLSEAALGWVMTFGGVQEVVQEFAGVARDGQIGAEELLTAKRIRTKAMEIKRIMEETITALDKGIEGR